MLSICEGDINMAFKEMKDQRINARATKSTKDLLNKLVELTGDNQADVLAKALQSYEKEIIKK